MPSRHDIAAFATPPDSPRMTRGDEMTLDTKVTKIMANATRSASVTLSGSVGRPRSKRRLSGSGGLDTNYGGLRDSRHQKRARDMDDDADSGYGDAPPAYHDIDQHHHHPRTPATKRARPTLSPQTSSASKKLRVVEKQRSFVEMYVPMFDLSQSVQVNVDKAIKTTSHTNLPTFRFQGANPFYDTTGQSVATPTVGSIEQRVATGAAVRAAVVSSVQTRAMAKRNRVEKSGMAGRLRSASRWFGGRK